jgi:hypothetical protein
MVQTYEDQGISGAKGRDQRPAFDQMLKDCVRRRFDILMVWSIDRLGRSVLHAAYALAELDAAGVALYSDQQAIDSTTPMGRAMIQMASVFGEQEREIIRSRITLGWTASERRGRSSGGRGEKGEGSCDGRNGHTDASAGREWHPQDRRPSRVRQRHRATCEKGNGRVDEQCRLIDNLIAGDEFD